MSILHFGKASLVILLLFGTFLFPQPGLAKQQSILGDFVNSSPGDIGWKSGFILNGTGGSPQAVAIDGSRVYVGGDFRAAGNVPVNNIAMWTGSTWAALGNGLNAPVQALAIDGHGHLYAGGWFTEANGKPALHIAKWDGSDWSALGGGLNSEVYAIAVDGSGRVYAGGSFIHAGGIAAKNIAMWDGTAWTALDVGISNDYTKNSWVYALALDRFGFLYAGGVFTQAGGIPAKNIARWDGENWSALGEGIGGTPPDDPAVHALATDNRGNLYAGGLFASAGGIHTLNIARWNGENWSDLGGGIQGEKFKVAVTSILADGGNLYVGGNFNAAGGNPMGNFTKWNGTGWETLSSGVRGIWNIFSSIVSGMAMDRDGRIFIVGSFNLAGGQCADTVASWDGVSWSGLGEGTSVDGMIMAMIPDHKGGGYAAGSFVCAGRKVVNHVAHWDGATWSGLDSGLSGVTGFALPENLALDGNGNLYVAGWFTQAGNVQVNNIAKWNGTSWEAMGGDLDNRSPILLAIDHQNRLYIAGAFNPTHSEPPVYSWIMRWNGSQWEEFAPGLNNSVSAIAFDEQDRLVAGGYFNLAGEMGVGSDGIARWNGQSWESLVSGCADAPKTLLIWGDTIYGGGYSVWKIENGNCEIIGGGINGPFDGKQMVQARALAVDQQGRLVVGGYFNQAGQVKANNIARYNGYQWENMGSGINLGSVYALAFDAGGNLLVAGSFSQAGGKISQNLAIWEEPAYYWLPDIHR